MKRAMVAGVFCALASWAWAGPAEDRAEELARWHREDMQAIQTILERDHPHLKLYTASEKYPIKINQKVFGVWSWVCRVDQDMQHVMCYGSCG
jgi:hypothetical protein